MDYAALLEKISKALLEVPSTYGGKEEGVIIQYETDLILKLQQTYQVDKDARKKIKAGWIDPDGDTAYWKYVHKISKSIVKSVAPEGLMLANFKDILMDAADILKSHDISFKHSVKNDTQIKDDIQGQIKLQLRKAIIGNNGSLFLGKFRVLTTMHYKIIKDMIKKYDLSVVCLVTGKETKFSRDIRYKMLETAFGRKIEIVEHPSGNLFGIMKKAKRNINVVLAGSDRVPEYENTLSKNPELSVQEIPRTNEDISATKVIAKIDDEKYFKKNTPKEIHKLYQEILKVYA